MQWRRIQRRPSGVALGGVVAVHIAVADRGDRPPEIVGVLRIPIENVVVGQAHVEQREQAGTFREPELLRCRKLARGRLP